MIFEIGIVIFLAAILFFSAKLISGLLRNINEIKSGEYPQQVPYPPQQTVLPQPSFQENQIPQPIQENYQQRTVNQLKKQKVKNIAKSKKDYLGFINDVNREREQKLQERINQIGFQSHDYDNVASKPEEWNSTADKMREAHEFLTPVDEFKQPISQLKNEARDIQLYWVQNVRKIWGLIGGGCFILMLLFFAVI